MRFFLERPADEEVADGAAVDLFTDADAAAAGGGDFSIFVSSASIEGELFVAASDFIIFESKNESGDGFTF